MVDVHEEIEVKYEFALDGELPSLSALLGGVDADLHVGDRADLLLDAVYFDTPDLRLSTAKTTLRRRTGGQDAGWHLKTPGEEGARLERRVPLGRAVRTVPIALRRLVEDLTAGQQLVPVARLTTQRQVQTVLDEDGRRVLEVADDTVEAYQLLAGADGSATDVVQKWREVELELLDGDRSVFGAVDAGLRAAGLTVSQSPSKVVRVLAGPEGGSLKDEKESPAFPAVSLPPVEVSTPRPAPVTAPESVQVEAEAPEAIAVQPRTLSRSAGPSRTKVTLKSDAGDVVFLHLRQQVQTIFDQDVRVRADEPDSVHKMRVATRRLRSALHTFQPLLANTTKPLRAELKWLAAELGLARDAEVLRDRLTDAVASLDGAGEDQPSDPAATKEVPQRVAEQLESAYRLAHEEVLVNLNSKRYHRLLDTLQELVEHPATTPKAGRHAGRELPKRVTRTYRTLAELMASALTAPPGHERDELFHEARKAAKQVRYAAEAVSVVFGKDAKRFAAAVTEVQEVLGEHQDSVVTRARLTELARQADPDVAFAYGRLFAQEELHARASEADVSDVWGALQAKRLHRWLR